MSRGRAEWARPVRAAERVMYLGAAIKTVVLCLLGLGLLLHPGLAEAQQNPPNPASRPILFVHGFCGDASSWDNLYASLTSLDPALYPRQYGVYVAWYDAMQDQVFFRQSGAVVAENTIPSNARFFAIAFYDPVNGNFDSTTVANISILNKAYELSRVIKRITAITHIKDVVVIAHSQGGLVARAYMENLASRKNCYAPSTSVPEYDNGVCAPGGDDAFYAYDMADLITLDTPHGGTMLAALELPFGSCFLVDSVNRTELEPASRLLQALNYFGTIAGNKSATKNPQPIHALYSYYSDLDTSWTDPLHLLQGPSDNVVGIYSQKVTSWLPVSESVAPLEDLSNPFQSADANINNSNSCHVDIPLTSIPLPSPVLHLNQCLGSLVGTENLMNSTLVPPPPKTPITPGLLTSIKVQATLNGQAWPPPGTPPQPLSYVLDGGTANYPYIQSGTMVPQTFTDVPVGEYIVGGIEGGPGTLSWPIQVSSTSAGIPNLPTATLGLNFSIPDQSIDGNIWSLTFTLNFISSPPLAPAVTTSAASNLQCDTATLNGTVNPNGSAASVYFEFGTDSQLSSFTQTAVQTVPTGTAPVSFSAVKTGLACNTIYYYRAVASNGPTPVRATNILSFTTLSTLPAPTLIAPANGSTGVALQPAFSWSAVPGASSGYRLIIATTPSALPTDPTDPSCGAGCVLNWPQSGLFTGNSFTPPAGTLSPGTVYYWEVHGRSPSQFGNWPLPVFSFTTAGGASAGDFSVNISPASETVVAGGSASFAVTTSTISGSPQSLALNVSNLPANARASFDQSTVISGRTAFLTIATSSNTPPGSYTLFLSAVGSAGAHVATTTFVVNGSGPPAEAPAVTTDSAGAITSTSAVLNGALNPNGSAALGWFQYGTDPSFGTYQETAYQNIASDNLSHNFSASVSGLVAGSTYYYRAVASNTGGRNQGSPVSFTTTSSTYALSVSASGGTVASADGGINCPGSCSHQYPNGVFVTLTANPPTGSVLLNWSGACTGNGQCVIPMTQDQSVTATFLSGVDSDLTVVVNGNGTVSSSDGNLNCTSTTCTFFYPANTPVTLTANPLLGNAFTGWGDACTGNGQCVLSMAHNTLVEATFLSQSGNTTMALSPGTMLTVAGNGIQGYAGDQGPATGAEVYSPLGVSVDRNGNLFLADFDNNRIRLVNNQVIPITVAGVTISPGAIATIAGTGIAGFSGDGGSPNNAQIWGPIALALDVSGNLYLSDANNNRIRVVNLQSSPISVFGVNVAPGTIQTIAGNGTNGYSGDGGPATSAALAIPQGFAFDPAGNLLIADWANLRIRRVDKNTGIITTIAGGGTNCAQRTNGLGDGCLAVNSTVSFPTVVAIDSFGNIFLTDTGNLRIRVIYQGGNVPGLSNPQTQHIYTLAGAGSGCVQQTDAAGDGCVSTDVPSILGVGLALDPGGSLYIADSGNALLRRFDRVTGVVTAVAGNGTAGFSGDGEGATNGELAFDWFWYGSVLAGDINGNLYFGDSSNNRIREILAAAAPLSFQETNLGSTSIAQRLLLENSGTAILSVPTIAVGGPDHNDFSESNTCNSSIQPGGSCTILVTYTPSHVGNSTATLSISSSNATNSPQNVALNGTTLSSTAMALTSSLNPATALSSVTFTATVTSSGGTPTGSVTFTDGPITLGTGAVDASGVATWSTSSLSAGTHSIAASYSGDAKYAGSTMALTQSVQQAVPIITWAAPAPITSGTALSTLQLNATASVAGTFMYNPSAGTVLGAGPQTLSVTFTPTDTTDYTVATATVQLIVTYPAITVAPSSGNFVDQPVGTASLGTTFTIHSSGTADLTLQPIALVSGQVFHVVANSCGASLAAGDICAVSVTFNPAAGGPASDSLQISSNALPSVLTLPLQGTGITSFASLSVNSVNFGSQPIASVTTNTVTLTNFGAASLSGIAISIAGANPSDFSYQADGCLGTTLVTHSSCLITVTFSPQATGLRSATLAISDNAPGSPQTVSLTGTGSTLPLVVTRQGTGNGTVTSSDGSISCGATCSANFNSGTTVTLTATPSSESVFTGWGGACSGTQPCSVTMNAAQTVVATFIPGVPTGDLSATSLVFGSQLVGVVSLVQVVTLSNSGNASLGITSIALAGPNASDFSQNNTCGLALAAGANCTISIVFTPSASGSRTASATLTDSLSVQNITLTGTGIAPSISFSPAVLTFPSQLVGTSSTSQAITVQNTGTAPLPMTSVVLGGANAGDFSQTNTCGSSLAAGASCTVSVIFIPSSFGNKTATLVLTDSVGTQSVDVSGTGTAALAALSPASLAFPNQLVGTPSAAQVTSLANGGNIALSVTSISLTGVNSSDFAQTNTCGTSVAAGSSCTISVIFTPSGTGARTASIAVIDSAGTQITTVSGVGTAPAVSLSSNNLIFANQTVGTSSTAQAVTLTNSGNGGLSISSISISGANSADFAQTNTCGTSVAAGANCTISITFVPTAAGSRTAAVTIVDNAGSQGISLAGTGVAAGPAVQLTPTSLSFGVQPVGVASSVRAINVANTGGSALSITSISVTGTNGTDFAQTNTCGTSVGAGGTCTISITFKPAAAGPRSAAITLQDGVGIQTVPLDGIGQAPLTLSPTSIAFSNQALGSMSGAQIITLTNNTGVLVSFSSIAVTGANAADFGQLSTTCGQTLALTSSCTVTLAFAPTATGVRTAALTLTDDATNSPQSIALSGSGILPVTVTASISFGTQKVGTTSQNKSVTIKNNLPTPLTFSTFSFGGTNPGDFRQSATTCGSTLAAGANCTVSIVFSPTAPGSRSAVFNVADNAITSPQSVALTGTGK